jgi:preprotein translocase subunit YajC
VENLTSNEGYEIGDEIITSTGSWAMITAIEHGVAFATDQHGHEFQVQHAAVLHQY